jgi:hypothetical protein
MTQALTQVVVWLNAIANAAGQALAFIGLVPGWLSATLIAIVSGMVMILVFKHTSNQRAIKRARQQIRSSLLSVKLFFDNPWVGFRGQAGALAGALKLLVFAVVPVLVMLVPVTLLLGQMALWYQARPLRIGEDAVISLKLDDSVTATWPFEDTRGPVRVLSEHEICWSISALKDGDHTLIFRVDGQPIEKKLAIGDGLMRVSLRRPDWEWSDALLHPSEPPFAPNSTVRSIEVQYPTRSSWTSGADSWVYYWFIVSLVVGFLLRGVFRVNL